MTSLSHNQEPSYQGDRALYIGQLDSPPLYRRVPVATALTGAVAALRCRFETNFAEQQGGSSTELIYAQLAQQFQLYPLQVVLDKNSRPPEVVEYVGEDSFSLYWEQAGIKVGVGFERLRQRGQRKGEQVLIEMHVSFEDYAQVEGGLSEQAALAFLQSLNLQLLDGMDLWVVAEDRVAKPHGLIGRSFVGAKEWAAPWFGGWQALFRLTGDKATWPSLPTGMSGRSRASLVAAPVR